VGTGCGAEASGCGCVSVGNKANGVSGVGGVSVISGAGDFRGRLSPPNCYRQSFSRDRPASKISAY
jgi:hypothetical protein